MRISQNSFIGGELDPDLMGRQDMQAYFKSAAKLENFIVLRSGAVCKRPGTDFVCNVPDGVEAGTCRLIAFPYDALRGDLLLMAPGHLYVLAMNNTWAHDVEVPYAAEDMFAVKVTQSGDTLFFCHPNYAPAKLVRYPPVDDSGSGTTYSGMLLSSDPADWTYLFTPVEWFPTVESPVLTSVTPAGFTVTTTLKDIFYKVSAVTEEGESLACAEMTVPVYSVWPSGATMTVLWTAVAGAISYRVFKKVRGAFGLIADVVRTSTVQATTGLTHAVSSLTYGTLAKLNDGVTAYTNYNANPVNSVVVEPDGSDDLFIKIDFGAGNTANICGVALAEGDYSYTATTKTTWPSGIGQFAIEYSSDDSTWTELNRFSATGLANSGLTVLTDVAVNATARYWRIIATDAATAWRLREIRWLQCYLAVTLTDDNIEPDLTQSPKVQATPFDGDTGYPSCMSLFQQRSVFAGVPGTPHKLWFSRLGDLYDFSSSEILSEEDMIEVSMAVTKPSAIKHMIAMRNLFVLTESGEWLCTPGNNADSITPTAIRFDMQSGFGCGSLKPLIVGQNLLFSARNDATVREAGFDLTKNAYVAQDRSVLSAHLFENRTMWNWDYQEAPDSIVWVVMDDGALLSWTYLPEHEVWAWARHSTSGGLFKDVACTRALLGDASNTDCVYVIVDRGETLGVCLERMRVRVESSAPTTEKAVCMDSVRATALAGIPTGFTEIGLVCGLPVTSKVETLRPEPADGSVHGLRKNVKSVFLRLRRCGCGSGSVVGPNVNQTVPIRNMSQVTADGITTLATGDVKVSLPGNVNSDGNIVLISSDPWPMTLLSIIYDVDMEK